MPPQGNATESDHAVWRTDRPHYNGKRGMRQPHQGAIASSFLHTLTSCTPMSWLVYHIASGHASFHELRSDGADVFPEVLPRFDDVKRLLAQEALRRANGNCSRAAELIGTTRQSVMRHVNKGRD